MHVLLATDRPSLGAALSLYLQARGLEVVGVVADALAIVSRAAETHADVVLVDWHLGEIATAEAVAELRRTLGHTPVVVLGSRDDLDAAQRSGAARFATLGDVPEALLALLREVVPSGS